jgi:4-amino-4-deoxy-L-arabinose transferase-like glycosyltransferase
VTTRPILVALTAGALVRLALLAIPRAWHDEATTGLMGLAVLRGHFPVYFFGQPFMGALDAYLAAPIYLVLGTSYATLKLLPVLLSIVWIALATRLAWELAGTRAAWWTALLLVVPPDFLLYWAHQARNHYPLALVLGTVALLLAHRVGSGGEPRATVRFWLLGFVLGLGFWTNFLIMVFLPAVALLAVRGGAGRLARGALHLVPAFALGSLPHWVYGVPHGTAIPSAGASISPGELASHLRVLWRVSWPALTGVPAGLRLTWLWSALTLGLAILYGAALWQAIRRGEPSPRRRLGVALALLIMTNVAVAVGTVYGRALDDHDQRYLLPVYAGLIPLLGAWLARRRSLARAGVIAIAVVLVQVSGAVTGTLTAFAPATAAQDKARAAARRRLVDRLVEAGHRRIYDQNPVGRLLTFLSGERVIFTDPAQEIVAEHALVVDGAPRAAWSVRSRPAEQSLAALGVTYRLHRLDGRGAVYADFTVPRRRVVEIDPRSIRVDASEGPQPGDALTDRRADTLWGTAGPQQGGEWLRVDLGATVPVTLVRWLPGAYHEAPLGIRLETSVDGAAWRELIDLPAYIGPLYWSAGRPMVRPRSGRVELRVPPTPARHLRITQTGRHADWRWRLSELFVYADAGEPAGPEADPSGETLARALRAAGVTRLYADHGWASRAALADPALRVPTANFYLDSYGARDPTGDLPAFHWLPGTGVLLEPADVPGFARTARAAGLEGTVRPLEGLELFVFAGASPRRAPPLPGRLLDVTASRNPRRAHRAVDGEDGTRWTTRGPRAAGDWFQVTLAAPRQLRGIRLVTRRPADVSESLRVEVAVDGATWRNAAATIRAERTLRWAGIALLADAAAAVQLDMEPPITARALRVVLTEGSQTARWSIHELEVHAAD